MLLQLLLFSYASISYEKNESHHQPCVRHNTEYKKIIVKKLNKNKLTSGKYFLARMT
jgi:hypothetical protein